MLASKELPLQLFAMSVTISNDIKEDLEILHKYEAPSRAKKLKANIENNLMPFCVNLSNDCTALSFKNFKRIFVFDTVNKAEEIFFPENKITGRDLRGHAEDRRFIAMDKDIFNFLSMVDAEGHLSFEKTTYYYGDEFFHSRHVEEFLKGKRFIIHASLSPKEMETLLAQYVDQGGIKNVKCKPDRKRPNIYKVYKPIIRINKD